MTEPDYSLGQKGSQTFERHVKARVVDYNKESILNCKEMMEALQILF